MMTDHTSTIQVSVDLFSAAIRSEDSFFRNLPESVTKEAERRYRMFLALVQKYPDEVVSPSKDIDEMWHIHMLHPSAYYEDCISNFGYILDHDGGYGSASAEEWEDLLRIFDRTAALWKKEFGEEYGGDTGIDVVAKCVKACAKCATKCRTACKKQISKRHLVA